MKVLSAGLTGRWVKDSELRLLAIDLPIEIGEDEERTHEIVEGVEVVQPVAPERLNLGVGDKDTAEGDQNTENEGIDERSEDSVGCVRGNKLAKTGVEKSK